jgi:hypothetical protein
LIKCKRRVINEPNGGCLRHKWLSHLPFPYIKSVWVFILTEEAKPKLIGKNISRA